MVCCLVSWWGWLTGTCLNQGNEIFLRTFCAIVSAFEPAGVDIILTSTTPFLFAMASFPGLDSLISFNQVSPDYQIPMLTTYPGGTSPPRHLSFLPQHTTLFCSVNYHNTGFSIQFFLYSTIRTRLRKTLMSLFAKKLWRKWDRKRNRINHTSVRPNRDLNYWHTHGFPGRCGVQLLRSLSHSCSLSHYLRSSLYLVSSLCRLSIHTIYRVQKQGRKFSCTIEE